VTQPGQCNGEPDISQNTPSTNSSASESPLGARQYAPNPSDCVTQIKIAKSFVAHDDTGDVTVGKPSQNEECNNSRLFCRFLVPLIAYPYGFAPRCLCLGDHSIHRRQGDGALLGDLASALALCHEGFHPPVGRYR